MLLLDNNIKLYIFITWIFGSKLPRKFPVILKVPERFIWGFVITISFSKYAIFLFSLYSNNSGAPEIIYNK